MFTKEDLDKQVLEALDAAKQTTQGLSPISSAIIERIKAAKKLEGKVKPTTW